MILIGDKLTYEEVQSRFEKEGYKLLSTAYKNAKSNLKVQCPFGHEWITNISNFDFGRRCSTCSRRKKYALDEVKNLFAKDGYLVQDTLYINGKTPIKVTCANGHETEINLNNFLNGKRCGLCRWLKVREARMNRMEQKAKGDQVLPRLEEIRSFPIRSKPSDASDNIREQERLAKMDEMRESLRSTKRRTFREQPIKINSQE
jgi:hypothetical protein